MKKIISSKDAPAAIGCYSQAIESNGFIFISGQIPLEPNSSELIHTDFTKQADQVLKNIQGICAASGKTLNDIIKLTIYLIDLNHFSTLNQIMTQWFQEPYPARATVQVAALPKGAQIEIDAIVG